MNHIKECTTETQSKDQKGKSSKKESKVKA